MTEFLKIQGRVTQNLKLATDIFQDPRKNIKNKGGIRVELSSATYGGQLSDYKEEAEKFQQEEDKRANNFGGSPVFDNWLLVEERHSKGAHYIQEYLFG